MLTRIFGSGDDDLKSRQDRRGRGAVLWAVAGVLLLQVAYYPMTYLWPQIHDGEFGAKLGALRSLIASKPKDAPCVVMVGGSLTSWGFNPSALTGVDVHSPQGPVVYNFGINNARTLVQLLCVRRVLEDGIRPDMMIVDTYVWDFNTRANAMDGEVFFPNVRLQEQDLDVLRRYDPKAHQRIQEWRQLHFTPWFSYRQNAQRYFLPTWCSPTARQVMYWESMDPNGWEYFPAYASSQRQVPQAKVVDGAKLCTVWMNTDPLDDETFPRAYREMADACHKAKVPILFVRMPETAAMRAGFSPAVRARLDGFFAELASRDGVQVADARDWAPDDGFVDGFHLDASGSTRFTQRLEREILGPQVFQRRKAPRP